MTTFSAFSALDNPRTFDTWARDYYHPIAERLYDIAIERMLGHLAPPPDAVVLDAGCGTGVHSVRVAKAGYRAMAVDVSEPALRETQRRLRSAGLGHRAKVRRADVTDLPFADESFDAIFSWGVLAHVPELSLALTELVRVLRPGGRVALQVTNAGAWEWRAERLARAALSRPPCERERLGFGAGGWCRMHGGQLWNWRLDVPTVAARMNALGCRTIYHGAVELCESQRRLRGPARGALLRLNNAWLRLGLPARPAATNLLVFEKPARSAVVAERARVA